jgi:hypothetical protein
VITTNHIDKLDPALGRPRPREDGTVEFISTRPGRIDKAIELGYMADADKLRLARRVFFDNDEGYQRIARLVEQEPDRKETPAQFQERCAQLALDLLWQSEYPEAAPPGGVPGSPDGRETLAEVTGADVFHSARLDGRAGGTELDPAQRA